MKVAIVGLGLIGGSIAIDLRREGVASEILGVDANRKHADAARAFGLVDEICALESAARRADLVVLAVPVDAIREMLPRVLDLVAPDATVVDTGSTKAAICAAVASHPRREQFVASHPIAGGENSGPSAALPHLFAGRTNVVCEAERSASPSLDRASILFDALGMRTTFASPEEHDRQLAFVSHLSHVTSFLLSETVLEAGREEKNMFAVAGTGLATTLRLAKAAPSTWVPIFQENAEHLGRALDEYIGHLVLFRNALSNGDRAALHATTSRANAIRPVLDDIVTRRSPALLSSGGA